MRGGLEGRSPILSSVAERPERVGQVGEPLQGLIILADPLALELVGDVLEKPFERAHPGVDLVLREEQRRKIGEGVLIGEASAALIAGELSEPEFRRGMVHELLGYHFRDATGAITSRVQLVSRGSSGTALRLFLEFARSREGVQLLSGSLALPR